MEKKTGYVAGRSENRQDPKRHFKYRFPGLRYPRLKEPVASDMFFPSIKSRQGNTRSQFFLGCNSDRWEVYPMKTKSHNSMALQDFSRNIGILPILKTGNMQSELGRTWSDHCRLHCIQQQTTELHTPWQNPAEPKIGQLNLMKLGRKSPLEMSEGHTQDTSKFQFHIWEPI
eukprot:14643328-Ditylum_brightwellii.AAC.1